MANNLYNLYDFQSSQTLRVRRIVVHSHSAELERDIHNSATHLQVLIAKDTKEQGGKWRVYRNSIKDIISIAVTQ